MLPPLGEGILSVFTAQMIVTLLYSLILFESIERAESRGERDQSVRFWFDGLHVFT